MALQEMKVRCDGTSSSGGIKGSCLMKMTTKNQGDQCQITGVELPGPESAKLQECVRIRSLCCLRKRDLCRSCFRWKDAQRYVSGGPAYHRVSMMHEIIQGSEASGVMFGGQQGSLVLSVSISTRKAIQAVVQVEVVFWRSTR